MNAANYDDNALIRRNLTSDGTRTYLYDIENRMVSGNGATLSYDPLGRLHQVTLGTGTTRFLYDGDALVAEYDGAGAMTRRYVHWDGADVPIMSYVDAALTAPTYLHPDHQGSIVALSGAAGAPVTINRYDEYGIPGAANSGRFQYTGQIWLAELGLYYYKARIYSPTLGRFMQTDPVGYQDQFNLYAYVGNDPVNANDPDGKTPAPMAHALWLALTPEQRVELVSDAIVVISIIIDIVDSPAAPGPDAAIGGLAIREGMVAAARRAKVLSESCQAYVRLQQAELLKAKPGRRERRLAAIRQFAVATKICSD
jgi:RHS repeat-associated protein